LLRRGRSSQDSRAGKEKWPDYVRPENIEV
jgi:hypothetical protein